MVYMSEQDAFECLYEKANEAIANNPDTEQVLAIQTATMNMYVLLNDGVTAGRHETEQQFLSMLSQSGDTHVLKVVALWRDFGPDLPSFHFRTQLAALDPRNMDTHLLVRGAEGYHSRALSTTL